MSHRTLLPTITLVIGALAAGTMPIGAQNYSPPPELEAIHVPYDALLDTNVRDGLVYYRALQQGRGPLNRYLAMLAGTPADEVTKWNKPRQMAFWINAYNAFVLSTVITHYPIRGTSKQYPANSIRQIPGAFETTRHAAGGRNLTLDQIETTVLAGYNDPRVHIALGRGAVGSGRLRSEAYSGPRLEQQLAQLAQQFATIPHYVRTDQMGGKVSVSPIISWRAPSFIAAYAEKSLDLPKRTPIELAVVGFIRPYLLPAEEAFIKTNAWQLDYLDFDWRLNDLTGGRP
jgi:uncharacterized protein DUF547